MAPSVFLAELPWTAYDAKVRDGKTVVMLPIGSLEQHGPHMAMNTDVLLPTAIAASVAALTGSLVAPGIQYGYKSQPKVGGGNHMPGTTSLDGVTLIATLRDVIKEFARHGVRKFCMTNGHFENSWFITEACDLALRELRWGGIDDVKIMHLSYWDFVGPEAIRRLYPDGFAGWEVEHGGVLETSLMLTLYPHLVDMSKVVDQPPAKFPPYDLFPLNPAWVPSSGCLSSAKKASKEKGDLLLEVTTRGIAEALRAEFGVAFRAGP